MKKSTNFLVIAVILFFMFLILIKSPLVFGASSKAFDIWKNNLVPVMLPFFVLADILINYNFVYYLTRTLSKITSYLFKINPSASFIFFMSIFSGFPSNAKYIKTLYDGNMIAENDAQKIILFSHFSNPLFIIGTIGLFLGSTKAAIVILISHYVTNIILGLLLRNYSLSNTNTVPKPLKTKPFIQVLGSSILSAMQTLLLILGTITFFFIMSTIILEFIPTNSFVKGIITGILEMSSGVKYIALTNTDLIIRAMIITMILSFGGLAVHIQTFSILDKIKIKYFPYLIARIAHALISGLITFLIMLRI